MTVWATLTWQAADPAGLASDLERRLGPGATARPGPGGVRIVSFGAELLEIVPWRRESADDHPRPAGRLVFEPVDPGQFPGAGESAGAGQSGAESGAQPARADGAPGSPPAGPRFRLAGVGWATVELDRAETELGPWLEPSPEAATVDGDTAPDHAAQDVEEPLLGGRTRVRRSPGLPGDTLILAEPVTEGRLAASLARDGEGPCALYLEPEEGLGSWLATAAGRGVALSPILTGPLGPSVLLTGASSGPHLIVVDTRAVSSSSGPGGTIEP